MTSESHEAVPERAEGETEGAPIIHLFGAPSPASESRSPMPRQAQRRPSPMATPKGLAAPFRSLSEPAGRDEAPDLETLPDRDALLAAASESLVKKLSRKQLSSREAHIFLLDFLTDPEAEAPLDRYEAQEIADQIVVEFEQRLYLNDAGLAEALVETLQNRKAVGRSVLARELTMRGIPREIIDEALGSLDRDEEAERALEFARDRARKLGSNLDEQAALRRLYGQLARRGYPGNIAQTAARTALRELRGAPGSARGRVSFS